MTEIDITSLKPSELLFQAMEDLSLCEDDPTYEISMGSWHQPLSGQGASCGVCLAGAVMAKTLNVSYFRSTKPDYFDSGTERALDALDEFRCGWVCNALHHLGYESEANNFKNRRVADYHQYPREFREDMVAIGEELYAAGL